MADIGKREFLKRGVKGALGFTGLSLLDRPGALQAVDGKNGRPNFVFIFCDDLGWGDLPCHGYRSVQAHGGWIVRGDLRMPNIDRMAAQGTMFTQFYVSSAVCSPSRTGLMTGQYPGRLGIHDYIARHDLNVERGMPDFLDPKAPTITRILRRTGYRTAHFGKWHLGDGDAAPSPEEYGIDRYVDCLKGPQRRVGSTEMIADETIRFIREHKDQPFYINAWLYDPHSPLHPTEEQLAPFKNLSPKWGDHYGALQVWYAVLSNIDRHVGRILDELDALGLSENTVVIFSSDNGPETGLIPFVSHYGGASSEASGPFRGIKRSLYEGGIREPFIVRWPGKTPAGAVDHTTLFGGVDFLPTVCSLAGSGLPEGTFDGEDLSPAILGKPRAKTKPLMWENRFPVYGHVVHKSPMLAIREGKWKLLMNPDRSRVELYDIPADPVELNNLADRHPEVVEHLATQVLAWQRTLPEGPVHRDAGSNAWPWPKGD